MPFVGPVFNITSNEFYPAVEDTIIDAEAWNAVAEDLANGLTAVVTRDGAGSMSGSLNMGSNKIVSLSAATNPGDAPRFDQIQPVDATLTAIAALAFDATNNLMYSTGVDTFALLATTAAGRSILTFVDPNADQLAFWDDSEGKFAGITTLTGLTLSGTTLAIDTTVVVTLTGVQTLTNKTLTTPVVSAGTISGTWAGAGQFSTAGNAGRFTNTTDSASVQALIIEGDRATPATNDIVYASFQLSDSAGAQQEFARISVVGSNINSGAYAGYLLFSVSNGGTRSDELRLTNTSLSPHVSGGSSLGTTTLLWNGAHLASGTALNWNNGTYTITQSGASASTSGALTVGGALTAANGGSLVGNFSGGIPVFQSGAAFIDANFFTGQLSSSMLLVFDTGDALGFDRTTNIFTFNRPLVAPVAASTETSGTLTTTSANRQIDASGGITIPASVFTAGDIITIYAGSASRTLTQGGGGTQRLHGTSTTGNLTLAARGIAGVRFISATEWVVSGDVS